MIIGILTVDQVGAKVGLKVEGRSSNSDLLFNTRWIYTLDSAMS